MSKQIQLIDSKVILTLLITFNCLFLLYTSSFIFVLQKYGQADHNYTVTIMKKYLTHYDIYWSKYGY